MSTMGSAADEVVILKQRVNMSSIFGQEDVGHQDVYLVAGHQSTLPALINKNYNYPSNFAHSAHSLILSSASSMLCELIKDVDLREQKPCAIILPDFAPDTVSNLLKLIYSGGTVTLQSIGAFVQLMELVELLQLNNSDQIVITDDLAVEDAADNGRASLGRSEKLLNWELSPPQENNSTARAQIKSELLQLNNSNEIVITDDLFVQPPPADCQMTLELMDSASKVEDTIVSAEIKHEGSVMSSDMFEISSCPDSLTDLYYDEHSYSPTCGDSIVYNCQQHTLSDAEEEFTHKLDFQMDYGGVSSQMCNNPGSNSWANQNAESIHVSSQTFKSNSIAIQSIETKQECSFERPHQRARAVTSGLLISKGQSDPLLEFFSNNFIDHKRTGQITHARERRFETGNVTHTRETHVGTGTYATHTREKRSKTGHAPHSGRKRFKCQLCFFTTTYKFCLKYHSKLHKSCKQVLKCNSCLFSTFERTIMNFHLKRHPGRPTNDYRSTQTEDKLVTCSCGSERKCDLRIHSQSHNKIDSLKALSSTKKQFKCEFCAYSCDQKYTLKFHKMIHMGEKPFKCEFCSYSFTWRDNLKTHMQSHTAQEILKCEHCSYSFTTKRSLKLHMVTHSSEKPFKCKKCSYSTSRMRSFKEHVQTHSGKKPFKCELCPYSFTRNGSLKRHMQIHFAKKQFKCHLCSYSCSIKQYLRQHMETHQCERPFKCEICSQSFKRKTDLKEHMKRHTAKTQYKYKCPHCSYSCLQMQSLKLHMRKHTGGANPFNCSQCLHSTSCRQSLEEHILKHSRRKPIKCEICPYSCIRKDYLKKHMHSHIAEKQFKCHHCSYSCSQKQSLTAHLFKHTGEYPFNCSQCLYSTASKTHLREHMKKHTCEKLFKCEMCSYTCAWKSNLKIHMQSHLAEKQLKCHLCSYSCSRRQHLNAHMKRHTDNKLLSSQETK